MDEPIAHAESLLPYARWTEDALRVVAADALEHVAAHGLPGEHHFYIGFRTGFPGVSIPGSLKARYPDEMTIVLQHRFWDLKVDRALARFSVGLSFGGIPATLVVPLASLTAFADPTAKFALRFQAEFPAPTEDPSPEEPAAAAPRADTTPQVVSLDAFRRKPAKE